MRAITRRRFSQFFTATEINRLLAWYVQAYDAGWRPADWSPAADGALRNRIAEVEEEQRVADGDVPWV